MNVKQGIKQLDIEEKAPLLTGAGFWTTRACPRIGLDSFSLADGPHGMRVQKKNPNHMGLGTSLPATCFPTAAAMACSWDEELCERLGQCVGEEAAFQGVSVVLGPGLNVKRSPLCGRNFEYFSEDGYLSGKLAAAYVRGIQSNGVVSCIKHFAVNSRELGRLYCDSVLDEQTLRETYLTGFEIAVKEGNAHAVMSAYNKVNGVYCNQNSYLLRDILRGEWKFDGLVVSDWGGTSDRVAAVAAGADLEMPCCEFSAQSVVSAVRDGTLAESAVNACVERIHALSVRAQKIERKPFDVARHSDFAARCAEESLVLLKNREGALPLSEGERIAVIGDFAETPRYQGAGSSLVNPTKLVNLLSALQTSNLTVVGYGRGFKRFGQKSKRLADGALKLAASADTVVLCLGLDETSETEGADRQHIFLPKNQTDLIRSLSSLGKKVVVVLSCGSVVDTSWDAYADGVLHASLAGQSGAAAVVRALTGEINPSGRLAESYIRDLDDCPNRAIYAENAYKMYFAEGIYVGYKYYNAVGKEVKYPFGYGLSYTRFSYENFSASPRGVRFTVKNVGERAGATVAQIYIRCPRPELKDNFAELKAFRKIYLDAGEERDVEIPFDEVAFRTYDMRRKRWQVGGRYVVMLGENSRDVLAQQTVELTEENYALPDGYVFAEEYGGEPESYGQYFAARLPKPEREGDADGSVAVADGGGERGGDKKKRRIVADFSTEVADLKYCKGFMGKIFGYIVFRYSHAKDKLLSNSMKYLPVRSLMQFMKFNAAQAEGFLIACNGNFFKGLKKIIFKK